MVCRLRSLLTLLFVLSAAAACATVVEACPTCKEGMENDPAAAAMIRGYFWSILFMMSMPFLIFGGLGTYFYLLVRKARAAQQLAPVPVRSSAAVAVRRP